MVYVLRLRMNRLLLTLLMLLMPAVAHGQATVFTPFCNGTDTARFTALIATIGANQATIALPYKSNPSQRCAVNTLTIPANITLDNSHGSGIKINSGQTLTIVGPVVSPPRLLFSNATAGLGTVVFSGNKSLTEVYPQWWGAVGDNATDNTAAFQAMLHLSEHNGSLNGVRYFIPSGMYRVNQLTYEGSFSTSFTMVGSTQGEAASSDGPWLRYIGPVGGTILTMKGANYCRVEHVNFDGNGLALKDVSLQYDAVRSVTSFDCTFEHCSFGGATGVNSILLEIGTSNFASAEHNIISCRFIFHGSAGNTYYGIKNSGSSNSKNYTIQDCGFIGLRWAVDLGNSGFHNVIGCSFANNTEGDIKPGGAQLLVQGCGSEGSKRLVDGSAGSSSTAGTLTIRDSYYAGPGDSNGYVVIFFGGLIVTGSDFWTGGATPPKFKTGFGDTGGHIISEGNSYNWNAVTNNDFIPFYDGGDRLIGTLEWSAFTNLHTSLRSKGDKAKDVTFTPAVSFPTWDIGANIGARNRTIVAGDWPGLSGQYFIKYGDAVVFAEGAAGPFGTGYNAVLLTTPANAKGHKHIIYKTDSGALPVAVTNGFAANLEGGRSRILLTNQHDFVEMYSDGTTWRVARYRIGEFSGILTVGGGGTVTYTWQNEFLSPPIVIASDTDTTPAVAGASSTTTTLTVRGTAGHVVNYTVLKPM